MSGVGEQCNGVYYLKAPTQANYNILKVDNFDLWYRRLGHPSNNRVSILPEISSRNRVDEL